MTVKKMSTKLIKPLTPTPPNLKNYKISFLDSLQLPTNTAVVLFYESKPESDRQLEESLARILVQFFPLAGRFIKEQNSIDCSDQGAEFVEAEALGADLVSKIGTDRLKELNDLLPDRYFAVDESATPPLLSIQATRFTCGGMALAVRISHRVFDASSLATFIAAWSSATNPDRTADVITPSFDLPSLLPVKTHGGSIAATVSPTAADENIVIVKLGQFDRATVASLKSKIGKPVSEARVACAVIAKALTRLDGVKRGGRSRGFRIFQPVNMRERTITPLPKHACGNFSLGSLTRRVDASEAEGVGIPELIDLIGESARNSINDHAEVVSPDRDGPNIIMNTVGKFMEAFWDRDTNLIVFTDWSKFGFYEADFGWGKPVWTSTGPKEPPSNLTVLMSNKEGDGIEAWMHLNQRVMSCIEQDGEFINQITSEIIHNFLSVSV